MSDHWFTESGSSGTVTIDWIDHGWRVVEPKTESLVKCELKGDWGISKSAAPIEVEGTVSKYMIGMGNKANYLHLQKGDSQPMSVSKDTSGQTRSTTSSYEKRNLDEISGSGDYVTVEATVDRIHRVNKQMNNTPDLKGKLIDNSVGEGVLFIVDDGVPHPYLEEGKRFRFTGVEDHYHKKRNEVQVKITHRTDFTELDSVSDPSPSEQEERDLSDITGTGDYVDIEATIKSVHAVNKDKSGVSDLRGRVTDDSIDKSVLLVIEDGVNHPYMEEGATFKFENVQDYHNKEDDKVQLRVTSRTGFSKVTDDSDAYYSKQEADVSQGGTGKKVHTQSESGEDSLVGKAKKKARDQNRDPAIDPHFQPDD